MEINEIRNWFTICGINSAIYIVIKSRYYGSLKLWFSTHREAGTFKLSPTFGPRQSCIRRLADNVPMEVISKDPAWTKVAEDLNDRYPILPIEDVIKELILHKTIVILLAFRFSNNFYSCERLACLLSHLDRY
jgi:hypothetical protein